MHIIDQAFHEARKVLRLNVTELGFTACSVEHDTDPLSNYRSVWARDSAITAMWTLPLGDAELTQCAKQSLQTVLDAQTRDGHLPNYVEVDSGKAEYAGVGRIANLDGPMWIVSAAAEYVRRTGDTDFCHRYFDKLHRSMKWLEAHDSNYCGLIEIPEASDWTDLFPRSFNVLYDEVLWYQANLHFIELRKIVGRPIERYVERATQIKRMINDLFWPTPQTVRDGLRAYADTQFTLGRTQYLIDQISPFGFSWRCDVYANLLAILYGVVDEEKSRSIQRFIRQVRVDQPYPVKVLYPAIRPGDPDWRDYLLVNLKNLTYHYHNGGIWPFVGGLWVRALAWAKQDALAEEALARLAALCKSGLDQEWEFTEWAHGEYGSPMGKAFQAWSAASYVCAYLRVQGDTSMEAIPPAERSDRLLPEA